MGQRQNLKVASSGSIFLTAELLEIYSLNMFVKFVRTWEVWCYNRGTCTRVVPKVMSNNFL